jgi:hypothetical protein
MVDISVTDYKPLETNIVVKALVDAAIDKMDERWAKDPFGKMAVIQP